ncbi:MAG: LytTR family DNA-binding domain-containing protein [Mucilaginibacter sp.]|uniref:LytR/AlgR family response regulator transcription factor n=1 Tax=Mucilaginibacter sp. TaxID=1882438 RepID=UPI0032634632
MLTCFIIDDEIHAIRVLSEYVDDTPELRAIGTFENPLLALEQINAGVIPDLIFMDINMPKLSGIQFAELIKDPTAVIFTTAYPQYAFEAFEVFAIDFLLKPISYDRFLKSINKLLRINREPAQGENVLDFYIQTGAKGKSIRVKLEDLIYAERSHHYVHLHLKSGEYKTSLTMKNLERTLPVDRFTRVHQSFIINHSWIESIEKNQVNLENKMVVSIGESYRDVFFNKIKSKILRSS